MATTNFLTTTLIVNHFAERARELGVDPDIFMGEVGLDPQVVADPFSWVPFEQALELFGGLVRKSGQPNFAFQIGCTPFHPSHWGIAGYAMVSAPSLEASNALVIDLMNGEDGDSFMLHGISWMGESGAFSMRPQVAPLEWGEDYQEYWIAQTVQYYWYYMGQVAPPHEVTFTHVPKAPVGEYERFFRCPVLFEQPITGFSFPGSWGDTPGAWRDDRMFEVMMRFAGLYTQAAASNMLFKTKVKYVLETEMREKRVPTLEETARIMKDSPRNIQRNLKSEGVTFSALLDDVRKNNAIIYLKNSPQSLNEIGYTLGFGSPSAFHHAFKRWTGLTPGQFRKKYAANILLTHPNVPRGRVNSGS